MRAYFLPELIVGLLVLLLGGFLFVLTAGYVVGPVWVWIFGPAPLDQPWLKADPPRPIGDPSVGGAARSGTAR